VKPLILKKHDQDWSRIRELLPDELDAIAGGTACDTIWVTPNSDSNQTCSGCDNCDGGGGS
jgi:hypothetical protein